jgi:hypothetical protein
MHTIILGSITKRIAGDIPKVDIPSRQGADHIVFVILGPP